MSNDNSHGSRDDHTNGGDDDDGFRSKSHGSSGTVQEHPSQLSLLSASSAPFAFSPSNTSNNPNSLQSLIKAGLALEQERMQHHPFSVEDIAAPYPFPPFPDFMHLRYAESQTTARANMQSRGVSGGTIPTYDPPLSAAFGVNTDANHVSTMLSQTINETLALTRNSDFDALSEPGPAHRDSRHTLTRPLSSIAMTQSPIRPKRRRRDNDGRQ